LRALDPHLLRYAFMYLSDYFLIFLIPTFLVLIFNLFIKEIPARKYKIRDNKLAYSQLEVPILKTLLKFPD
jgi:hypothetical protein